MQKIVPHFWFDREAVEAADYVEQFINRHADLQASRKPQKIVDFSYVNLRFNPIATNKETSVCHFGFPVPESVL